MEPVALVLGLSVATAFVFHGGKGVLQRLAWRRVRRWAAERGLKQDGSMLSGVFGHRRIQLHRFGGLVQPLWIELSVMLQPSLDLGLRIQSELNAVVPGVPEISHPPLEQLGVWVQGEEARRCLPLLQGEVLERLQRYYARKHKPLLLDDRLVLRLPADVTPEQLQDELEQAGALCDAIDERRGRVPPFADLEVVADSWRAAALRRRLTLSCTPLSLIGQVNGQVVWAVAVRLEDGYGLDVLAWFNHPLPEGTALRSRPPPSRKHRSFAAAFETEPRNATELFDKGTRRALLRHHRAGIAVRLDEESLWLRLVLLPRRGRDVVTWMDEVSSLAREIALRSTHLRAKGGIPYRRMAPA